MVLNTECVTAARVVITRLVKGRLSDSTKRVVVDVPKGHENITLVLECDDSLPYSIQIELVEVIKVKGRKKIFAERSEIMLVPLICPWSESASTTSATGRITFPCLMLLMSG